MDKRRILIFVVILILVVAGFVRYFYLRGDANKLVASGTIEATEVVVSSKAVGRVLEIKADEGDEVSKGDLLAQIEERELAAALKSAQAKYKVAKNDYKRGKELFKDKTISPQQYEALGSALEVASAALDLARLQYENASIKAPISGTVLARAIEKGELAVAGSPILTLADLKEVNLTVYLAERDIGKVKLGEEVLVSVDSYPDEKFKGKIVYISEKAEFTPKAIQTKAERVTQVFGIKIKISNPESKLKPGMPADAEFQWNSQ